jgi:hypothetical protein
MHTNISLDVARSLTPGDSWWDRPKRRSLLKLAVVGLVRLHHMVLGR